MCVYVYVCMCMCMCVCVCVYVCMCVCVHVYLMCCVLFFLRVLMYGYAVVTCDDAIFHFGEITTYDYSMDFCHPLSALQAFAIALTKFDTHGHITAEDND